MVERGSEPDTVVVPVDDSPLSDDALEYAIEHHPDSKLVVLHVIDIWQQSYTVAERPGAAPGTYLKTLDEYAHDQAQAILDEADQVAQEHGVSVTTETETGQVPRTIVEYADEHDVDGIVIGSHGRTGATRILLGSVAEKVMRQAPCPVTVVR